MSNVISKGKASPAEEEKLIEEIQTLIKEKQLGAKLTVNEGLKPVLKGCATCTVCPCMICW
jgi:hypothetical protein